MTATLDERTEELLAEFIPNEDDLADLTREELAVVLEYLTQRMTRWSFDKPGMRNEKALIAEAMLGKVDWLLYGGAAGGAKTECGLKHAYELSLNHPRHTSLILRTSKPELQRSIVMRSVARFMQMKAPAKLSTVDNVKAWKFTNQSVVEFGYCARLEDVGQYLSAEYQFIWPDESTQFLEDMIRLILARLRTTIDTGLRPHALLTTNPGDRSHAFHKETFIDPTAHGDYVVVYNVENGLDGLVVARRIAMPQTPAEATAFPEVECGEDEIAVAFVQSKSTDNPYLDRRYRAQLSALPEIKRKQMRDGDWETFSGKFFTEWNFDVHTVPTFPIPVSWARGRALDWGYAKPYCCLWGAWDEDGNCYVYREDYGPMFTATEQAQRVTARSMMLDDSGRQVPERIARTLADPAVFTRNGSGDSVAGLWQRAGLHVLQANNDRRAGWANIRDYLRPVKAAPDAPAKPHLFVMRNCENLIRTLPLQQFAKDSEDMDTDGEDHAADTLRYLLMQRPITRAKPRSRIREGMEGMFDRRIEQLDRAARRKKGRRF